MSIGLFGRKIGMTQIFADDGTAVSVTLVQAETCLLYTSDAADE